MHKANDDSIGNKPSFMPAFEWKGSQSLRRVYALNEHCLEVMSQLARDDRERTTIEAVNQLRGAWRALDVTARQRAATCPVLLLDAQFQNEEWWRWAKDARPRYRRTVSPQSCFAPKQAEALMRETLMLVWSIAGAEPNAATVLFGVTPTVGNIIAEFGPQQVERIAALHGSSVRPRWADIPDFWRKLLRAACADDEESLHDVRLYSIQLLGGELIPLLENIAAR